LEVRKGAIERLGYLGTDEAVETLTNVVDAKPRIYIPGTWKTE
jgi:hypothetical protein